MLNNKLNIPSLGVEEVAVVLAILAVVAVLALTQTHREVMDLAVLKPLVEDLAQLAVAVVQLVEVKVVILDKQDKTLAVTVEIKDGVFKVGTINMVRMALEMETFVGEQLTLKEQWHLKTSIHLSEWTQL